jgi:hypothetical protein
MAAVRFRLAPAPAGKGNGGRNVSGENARSVRVASAPGASNPWRRTIIITALAVAVFVGVRWLPVSGDALHYTDFRVGEKNFLEFCEPGGPQFVPVDRVHSPVTLALDTRGPLHVGEAAHFTAKLTSSSGKPVTTDDLLVVHTEKLHLLIVDASLDDYQHIHPRPTGVPGEFSFDFAPRRSGAYRVFADFTPRATGRALYAGAALRVEPAADGRESAGASTAAPELAHVESTQATLDGFRFTLGLSKHPLRINDGAELTFSVARLDGGGPVVLEEIMGAYAHLVAFDEKCTGFAHLHPTAPAGTPASAFAATQGSASASALAQTAPPSPPDAPQLFALKLTDPGFYRVWAQVKIAGRERFVPFGLRVEP